MLGRYAYVRSNPVICDLVLIKRTPKGRHKRSVFGIKVRSRHSLKQSRASREPWLLAASPTLSHLSAQALAALYAQRMQIEETFRDLKNERFGLGLSASRSTQRQRLAVLGGRVGAGRTFALPPVPQPGPVGAATCRLLDDFQFDARQALLAQRNSNMLLEA